MTMPGASNPMEGDSAANPFSPGGNPMSSGEPGMSPVGDGNVPMPAAPSQTTKPRQMPGGAPPSVPGGAPGSMQPAAPGGTGGDTNVPQSPQASPSKAMAKVREVRRDIVDSNPDMLPRDAHHLAMQVVAFQILSVSPQSIAAPGTQSPNTNRVQQAQQGRRDSSGGYFGDLNDPRNPYSPNHPNHPMHGDYQMGINGGNSAPQGGGQRNPLADHARAGGYGGQYPTLVGGTQKALSWGAGKAMDWFKGHPEAPDQAPGEGAPIKMEPRTNAPQPPPVRQRVIPAPTAPAPAQQATQPKQPPQPKQPGLPAQPRQQGQPTRRNPPRRQATMVYPQAGER